MDNIYLQAEVVSLKAEVKELEKAISLRDKRMSKLIERIDELESSMLRKDHIIEMLELQIKFWHTVATKRIEMEK